MSDDRALHVQVQALEAQVTAQRNQLRWKRQEIERLNRECNDRLASDVRHCKRVEELEAEQIKRLEDNKTSQRRSVRLMELEAENCRLRHRDEARCCRCGRTDRPTDLVDPPYSGLYGATGRLCANCQGETGKGIRLRAEAYWAPDTPSGNDADGVFAQVVAERDAWRRRAEDAETESEQKTDAWRSANRKHGEALKEIRRLELKLEQPPFILDSDVNCAHVAGPQAGYDNLLCKRARGRIDWIGKALEQQCDNLRAEQERSRDLEAQIADHDAYLTPSGVAKFKAMDDEIKRLKAIDTIMVADNRRLETELREHPKSCWQCYSGKTDRLEAEKKSLTKHYTTLIAQKDGIYDRLKDELKELEGVHEHTAAENERLKQDVHNQRRAGVVVAKKMHGAIAEIEKLHEEIEPLRRIRDQEAARLTQLADNAMPDVLCPPTMCFHDCPHYDQCDSVPTPIRVEEADEDALEYRYKQLQAENERLSGLMREVWNLILDGSPRNKYAKGAKQATPSGPVPTTDLAANPVILTDASGPEPTTYHDDDGIPHQTIYGEEDDHPDPDAPSVIGMGEEGQ